MLDKSITWMRGALLACLAAFSTIPGASAETPDTIRLAVIVDSLPDVAWVKTLASSLEEVNSKNDFGLTVAWEMTDPLTGNDAEEAIRFFAESGEYDVILGHATYSDQFKNVAPEFPDIMFVTTGSGNYSTGPNHYLIYKRLHEPAYLLGLLAGHESKSGTLAVIGTFTAEDVNDEINAFFEGARTVRGDITPRASFINSWYDNALAAEHAEIHIAAGADTLFMLTENFKPCERHKLMCFGNLDDLYSLSPESIASSTVMNWVPDLNWIIGEWLRVQAGGSFAATGEHRWFGMAEGGTDIAPFHDFEDRISETGKAEVAKARDAIIAGELVVKIDTSDDGWLQPQATEAP